MVKVGHHGVFFYNVFLLKKYCRFGVDVLIRQLPHCRWC